MAIHWNPLAGGLFLFLIFALQWVQSRAIHHGTHNYETRGWSSPQPKTVKFNVTLTWEDYAPVGIPRKMILTNGQSPGPTLELAQGDTVEFLVDNQLPFDTTIHFHGSFMSFHVREFFFFFFFFSMHSRY